MLRLLEWIGSASKSVLRLLDWISGASMSSDDVIAFILVAVVDCAGRIAPDALVSRTDASLWDFIRVAR